MVPFKILANLFDCQKCNAYWYNGIIKCKSNIVPPWSKLKTFADDGKSMIDRML